MYRGEFNPAVRYRPGDISLLDGRYRMLDRTGIWKQLSRLNPEPSDMPPKDGRDGRDGKDGERGPQGERGKRGPAGKDGESWLYKQRIGSRPQSSGEISHPLSFSVVFGQAVTASGLASMSSPKVLGVADSTTTYRTEGPIVFDADILTPGATYYLDATVPGQVSATAPTADGHYVVVIGRALDSRTLDIEITNPVLL